MNFREFFTLSTIFRLAKFNILAKDTSMLAVIFELISAK